MRDVVTRLTDCSVTDSISAFNARPKILRTPDGVQGQMRRGSPGDGPPPQPKYSDSSPTPRPGSGGRLTGEQYHLRALLLMYWPLMAK